MEKPILVYVSGAPGSGKTTLAALLSEQLYIPHISSDLIHGGVSLSQVDHDRHATLLTVFVPSMIDLGKRGISLVVDQVLQKDKSEADIIDRLKPCFLIINVHTFCSDPIERYTERIRASQLPDIIRRRDHLLSLAEPHTRNLPRTAEPLDLNLPQITVNTDDGYDPSIDEITKFVLTQAHRRSGSA